MKVRFAFLGMTILLGGASAIGVACGTPGIGYGDAGSEGSMNDGKDASLDVSVTDGSRDAGNLSDSARRGNCSAVQGPDCDLVLQTCATGKECVVVLGSDGGPTPTCRAAGTGNRPLGATCCPGQANQCVPGLECIGPSCTDGGAPQARCTPHCCVGDDTVCGQSVPEGFRGSCDLNIVLPNDASTPLYNVCTYKGVCKPFHVQSCPTNYTCLLQSDGVSFRCDEIYISPGKPEDTPCTIGNECGDGLMCLGPTGGGASKCTTMCYRRDAGPPFDASALTDAAGYGGCSATKGCGGTLGGAPDWLGFCTP